MRKAVSYLMAGLLMASMFVIGISSPASAAINRCGDAYTSKTDWYTFSGDNYKPHITKVRLRAVPGTQRVCAEFARFNRDDFRIKNVQIQAIQGKRVMKVCFAAYCKFRVNYTTTKFLFALQAKKRGTNQPFYSYSNYITLRY